MTGRAYRTPNRGPAGCGAGLAAFVIVVGLVVLLSALIGASLGWW